MLEKKNQELSFSMQYEIKSFTGVSRTLSNIWDRAFYEIVNALNTLIIFDKSFIFDFQLCSEHASEFSCKQSLG